MRILLTAIIGLSLLATTALAAEHHAKEKKLSAQITISQTVKIGGKTLAPGLYVIACDHETITFTATDGSGKKLVFPCKGKELAAKSSSTEIRLAVDGNERVVTTLLLEGSTIEHTF